MRPRTPYANTQIENHDKFNINHIPVDLLPRAMASRFPGELPDNLSYHRHFLLLSFIMEEDLT